MGEPLRHDPRHAIAHRHAVKGISDLHRPLLMRNDNELRLLTQLLEDLQKPRKIHIIKSGLDLVHDVKG